jgi:hypothetical protein
MADRQIFPPLQWRITDCENYLLQTQVGGFSESGSQEEVAVVS